MVEEFPLRPYRNQGCSYRVQIAPEAAGQTVLAYLSRHYPHSTPAEWQDNINAGLVLLDNNPATPDSRLVPGAALVWHRPPWTEPPAPRGFKVIYEDSDLLAVTKPAGLPTLPGAGFYASTLLHLVQQYCPQATPLHRLGRWTSGLVLCARTDLARSGLMRQWSAQQVNKRYRALATGALAEQQLTITTRIGPVYHPLLGSVHGASTDGKPARSVVTLLEQRPDQFLCDVLISTGRPHQIRIHLAAAGHPLVGDPLYGSNGLPLPHSRALPGDPGYQLHAAELGFLHPISGVAMTLHSPPPPILQPGYGAD